MYNDKKIISIIELYLMDRLHPPLIDILFASLDEISKNQKSCWNWYLNSGRLGFAITGWIFREKNPENWQKIMSYKHIYDKNNPEKL